MRKDLYFALSGSTFFFVAKFGNRNKRVLCVVCQKCMPITN